MNVITSMETIPNAKTSDWDVGERDLFLFSSMLRSSGAIHLGVPLDPEGAEVSVQLRLEILVNPKSPSRAQPDLSINILS